MIRVGGAEDHDLHRDVAVRSRNCPKKDAATP
jgi:hypothetical protein